MNGVVKVKGDMLKINLKGEIDHHMAFIITNEIDHYMEKYMRKKFPKGQSKLR